jgi:hypothetical protein
MGHKFLSMAAATARDRRKFFYCFFRIYLPHIDNRECFQFFYDKNQVSTSLSRNLYGEMLNLGC